MSKAKWVITLLWLIAMGLVSWTLTQLPLNELLNSIAGIARSKLAIWAAANIVIILIFNFRWWIFCRCLDIPIYFLQLLFIRQAGQTISFITPGPQFGGEPLQIYWLWHHGQVALHKALLALGMDRFFELWINFSILISGVALLMTSSANATADWGKILITLAGLAVLMSLIGWALLKQPQWISRRVNNATQRWQSHRYLHHIQTQWNFLSEDLSRSLKHKKKYFVFTLLLSLIGWGGLLIELQLILWMAKANTDLIGFLLLFVAMRLALLLPLPGGIGTLEAAVFWVFHYLNLPMETTLSVIALMRLRDVAVVVFGLACVGVLQKPKLQPAY